MSGGAEAPSDMAENGHAKLYVVLGSHACRTGILLLQHKRIPFKTVSVPAGAQVLMPLWGFPGRTVPALEFADGTQVQPNCAIARALEEREPERPLFPSDPERRAQVEEVERWASDDFQMLARRLALAGALPGSDVLIDGGSSGRLGPILWRDRRRRLRGMRMAGRLFKVTPETEAKLLARLPEELDRVEAHMDDGLLNGADLNAADYEIAPSLALLTYRRDTKPLVEGRRTRELLDRVLPAP